MKKITSAIRGYFNSIDKWLLFFWMSASLASIPFLWTIASFWPQYYSVTMQLVAIPIGFFAAVFVSVFDYHTLLKLWKLYIPVMVILMVLTFIYGRGRGDANVNWIEITLASRKFSLQPSEFLKIAFITTFSLHLAKVKSEMNSIPNALLLCLHGGAYIALMYQDMGSMLVFISIFVTMLFCAGLKWRYIFAGAAATVAAVPFAWTHLLSEDQKVRFLVVTQPELNPAYAFQQLWGLVALSIGGQRGTGLFAEKHIYVPEMYNDMIFTFIGETSGFIGCLGVVFLLSAISLKILYNSGRAKDDTGRYICVGVFAMIVSQTFINLGMCLRVLPVIGITLPLFSSGGTSIIALYLGLGLVLSVYRHTNTGLFSGKSA